MGVAAKYRANIHSRMVHVKIFLALLNLVVGVLVASHVFQVYKKYTFSYLRSLTGYIIFFNLFILFMILDKYLEINVNDDVFRKYSFKPDDILLILAIIVDIGFVYSVVQIGLRFFDNEIPVKAIKWLFSIFVLIIVSYMIRPFVGEDLLYSKVLYFIYNYFYDNFLIIEIIELIALIYFAKGIRNKKRKTMVVSFSYLYLSRYAIFLIIFFLLPISELLPFIVLLYFNLIPLIWLKYYFYPYANSMQKLVEGTTGLNEFFEKFKLTKREQEIALLVLDGKSNKEIEVELFISFHTVKNHISSIFRKCEIKTRHQLIHLLTQKKYL